MNEIRGNCTINADCLKWNEHMARTWDATRPWWIYPTVTKNSVQNKVWYGWSQRCSEHHANTFFFLATPGQTGVDWRQILIRWVKNGMKNRNSMYCLPSSSKSFVCCILLKEFRSTAIVCTSSEVGPPLRCWWFSDIHKHFTVWPSFWLP